MFGPNKHQKHRRKAGRKHERQSTPHGRCRIGSHPVTNLTARQRLNLSLVASADGRWRDGKRNLEAEIRREIKERTQYLVDDRSDAVLVAHESGVPKTQISLLGLHTKNTKAVNEAIRHAAKRAADIHRASPFSRGRDQDEVVITLTGALLAEACADHGWTADEATELGAHTATFAVTRPGNGGEPVLVAVTKSFVLISDKAHPVVAWGRAHADEALSWWNGVAA